MAGHNKWTQIKRAKGSSDAKRAQLFSKLSRMISSQVKVANGDQTSPLVRAAIEKARKADMSIETIERAINKATETKELETIIYEAYGPGGVGIIIQALTDSKNRAAQEIRHILSKNGTSLAGVGSVLWAFKVEGGEYTPTITVPLEDADALALDALIEELEASEEVQEVITNAE